MLLLLPGLVLGNCASGKDAGPPMATEQQGMRLLRAVTAIFPLLSPAPAITALRERPGIKLGLAEFGKQYPDPTDAQFAFLRWWSSRYQDIDMTPSMREAATLIPLLLPEADDTALEQALVGYPALIFVYDPPMHQPDSDVMAVFLAKDSGLFKAIYNDSSQAIGGIQPIVVEQAMSRLLLAARNPGDTSLPVGLQKAGLFVDANQQVRVEEAWIQATLRQLRDEQKHALNDQNMTARVLGQPFSESGRRSLYAMLLAIPLRDAVRHHPAVKATIAQSMTLILAEFNYRESARHEVRDWSAVLDDLYPRDAPDDDPKFRQALDAFFSANQADVLPDQPMSP